jgi:hypothetical protein
MYAGVSTLTPEISTRLPNVYPASFRVRDPYLYARGMGVYGDGLDTM